MNEAADKLSTTWLALFMERVLHHKQRRAEGDYPLDVDIAIVVELRKFLNVADVPLPSDEFLQALSAVLSGGAAEYFNTRRPVDNPAIIEAEDQNTADRRGRPTSVRRQHLVGTVAHLVETLAAGDAFKLGYAATVVASQLKTAGLCRPDGKAFNASIVTRWHEYVAHHAKDDDPAHDMFEMQQRALKRLHPDHMKWGEARLREWLAKTCRHLARHSYLNKSAN